MKKRQLSVWLVYFGLSAAVLGCEEDGMIVLMGGDRQPAAECENGDAGCLCENGDWRCLEDEFQVCIEQTWKTLETCEIGECVGKIDDKNENKLIACSCDSQIMCSENGKNKTCVETRYEYGTDTNGEKLDNLYYSRGVKKCPENYKCSNGKCLPSAGCNTEKPDGNWKCENNTWVSNDVCDNSDKFECVDKKYKECVDGKWEVEDCNGKRQCKDNKCIECDDEIKCDDGYLCKDNNCVKDECFGNNPVCDGDLVKSCQEGKWGIGENCSESGKVCENGHCVICREGETRCNPNNSSIFQVCDNGWHDVVNCGDKRCSGERIDNSNQFKACDCNRDEIGTGMDRYCYFECGGGFIEYGVIEYKNNWIGKVCDEGYACDKDNNKCVLKKCEEGEYKCTGKNLMRCEDNQWKVANSCSMDRLCNAERKSCDDCVDGEYQCPSDDSPDRKKCVKGKWVSDSDGKEFKCKEGEICSKLDGGACIKNKTRCEKDKSICKSRSEVMTCSQGRWNVTENCNGNDYVCGQKGKDAKCVNMIKPEGGPEGGKELWSCDDKYKEYKRCDQTNDNTDGNSVRVCNASKQWEMDKDCKTNKCGYKDKTIMCIEKTDDSKECTEYSYVCDQKKEKVQFCIDGKLEDFANCKAVGLTCMVDHESQAHCGKNN